MTCRCWRFLRIFAADPALFRSGWFVELLASLIYLALVQKVKTYFYQKHSLS